MNKDAEPKTTFKFLEAELLVKRIRPNPAYLIAHNIAEQWGPCDVQLTRVELKTFIFSSGSQSLSIDNAVLGPIPIRLLFTKLKNKDFIGSLDTNPYLFHYDFNHFALYVNVKQIPSKGLSLDMGHEKNIGHWIKNAPRGIWNTSLELRTPKKPRNVYSWPFNVTIRPDTSPRRI